MTTITRERLEQIYAECEERDPAIFEVRELVRIALASLDAEIVRYLNKFSGTCVTLEQQPNAADDVAVYIPLYTAPPAQIVSIPDDWQTCEKLSDDNCVDNALRELVEDTTGDNGVRVVQAVIRALRDSGLIRTYPDLSQPVDHQISEYEKIMLQAGNSPVIPEGSFSGLVNSARALLDVLYEFGADEVAISEYVTNLEDALRVAAAPQQEVK